MKELMRAKELVKTDPDQALNICNNVLDKHFDEPEGQLALFMIGYIMQECERFGLAYQIYQRCKELNPQQSEIYSNMGMCLEEYSQKKALKMFRIAQAKAPKNAKAMANEALMHLQMSDPERCIELCNKSLYIDSKGVAAKHNKALALLMMRKWREGWRLYYETFGVKHRERRDYGVPDWDGKSPGTVLVYGEQGVGDEIMFASCLSDIDNPVIFDCDARLLSLFSRSFDFPVYGTRFSERSPLVDECKYDWQISIGQLPHFYRNNEKSFPGHAFLKPDLERSLMFGALFDTYPGRKIGIAWRGGCPNTGEKRRSLELSDFDSLFGEDTFISLEYRDVDPALADKYGLKCFKETAKGESIDGLASIICNLDLVITCCTTVVYVAGALGIPCICLVPDKPSYRYHIEGSFPWFSSVELIRQEGTWRNTIDKNLHRLRYKGEGGIPCLQSQHSAKGECSSIYNTH